MSKNIASFIDLPPYKAANAIDAEKFSRIEYQLAAFRAKFIDEFIIKQLYAAYKDTPISKLLVIDMTNFEDFLRRYLPIYLKKKEQQQ